MLFCNLNGNPQVADTVVTIKTSDGTEYHWEPTLDNIGFPNILVGDERELLSWDFTPIEDTDFDWESWFAEGWSGPTAVGLAYDGNGTEWVVRTWDNSVTYRLCFYLDQSDKYDGEAELTCYYEGDSSVQAKWKGNWRIKTKAEQPSRLYLALTLTGGADRTAFQSASIVSETYFALIPQSGNDLLLVANDFDPLLPVFPKGVRAVQLSFGGATDLSELTYLRAKIQENDSTVGVAYVGFVPNTEDVFEYNCASDFSTNNIFKEYPFFYGYPISVNVGHDMFSVVPLNESCHVKIYKVNFGKDGELYTDKDTVLYEDETGKPFFILCNEHEAYSNVLITVTNGDETVEFSPRISIEDDSGLLLADGCYDFTVKDIRDYVGEVRAYLSENIEEITDEIENGMLLLYNGEENLYGHYVLKYKLGYYDENADFQIVREYFIDEYYTMAYYEPDAGEKTKGWRMVGKGFDCNSMSYWRQLRN